MAKVAFTEHSLSAIDEIAAYIALDSEHYASLQIAKIFARVVALEDNPRIGRVVPELKLRSVREVIEGNYRIIYKVVSKDLIHILTVHHSRRQLKRTEIKEIAKRGK